MYINERLGSVVIKGIGIDLIELNRIHHSMQQSDRLMQRILTTYEQTVFQKLKSEQRRVEYLAGRFAAKEAFAKATGQGIGQLSFQHIEVRSNDSGAPELYVKGYDNVNIFISITHTKQYAAAQVVIEDVLSSK